MIKTIISAAVMAATMGTSMAQTPYEEMKTFARKAIIAKQQQNNTKGLASSTTSGGNAPFSFSHGGYPGNPGWFYGPAQTCGAYYEPSLNQDIYFISWGPNQYILTNDNALIMLVGACSDGKYIFWHVTGAPNGAFDGAQSHSN